MSARPSWALASGLPSLQVARAARRVASLIDPNGSLKTDMRRSYQRHASGALYPEDDLVRGQQLLVDIGLVTEANGWLHRTPGLSAVVESNEREALAELAGLVAATLADGDEDTLDEAEPDLAALVPDEARRRELLIALGEQFDDARNRLIGEIGEELVVAACRQELRQLGQRQLAEQVRQVSLASDRLGYDVVAPRVVAAPRLLETKSTGAADGFSFFVSHNEINAGARNPDDWFLVACRITDTEVREGTMLGWASHAMLEPHLPADRGAGTWQSVRITLDQAVLKPGLPPAS